jgi:hypothetical protein
MKEEGVDVKSLIEEIQDLIIKTISSVQPSL